MSVDPVLPHDLDDLYGPGAEDADTVAESEWHRKHYERKGLSIYEVYSELQDILVSYADDGDGYIGEAPQEVRDHHNKRVEDIENALMLLYPYVMEYAATFNLKVSGL